MQDSVVCQFSLDALHAAGWGGSLPVAVAHNGVAALLLAALVMLNFAAYSPSSVR